MYIKLDDVYWSRSGRDAKQRNLKIFILVLFCNMYGITDQEIQRKSLCQ